ncbi:hypothetical protein PHMEG_00016065 [Phytophthora megakarya]|uniref:Uncharacterized protein n=1 Tax=Phytophthora megakarya TaxID=4795 RepID=A0A225W078_9STRA|nr:hypothetical protein PHMEG_00016065 [Phytophthora megakarya]
MLNNTESPLVPGVVEQADVDLLREMGLLRDDINCHLDSNSPSSYGKVSDHGANVSKAPFESRAVLQRRCREFARAKGFSLRVFSNCWRKANQEGNAKYVCKLLKGQQQLVPGSKPSCPFYINVYCIRGEWRITSMCLAHDHYRNCGFQTSTFVEGELADDTREQRQRDVPFSMMEGILEREIVVKYDQNLTRRATSAARSRERDGPGDRNPTLSQDIKTSSKIRRATRPVSDGEKGWHKIDWR